MQSIESPRAINLVVAFEGDRLIASGTIAEVSPVVASALLAGRSEPILAFDATSSELVELDPRATTLAAPHGSESHDVSSELAESPRGPGRPRLGVVAREITLLPRHWEWLATQPGGASATIRRLIEQARSASAASDRVRLAKESAYRFMSAMVGNQPLFEDAIRALFADDGGRFTTLTETWPADLRDHARRLAETAFQHG